MCSINTILGSQMLVLRNQEDILRRIKTTECDDPCTLKKTKMSRNLIYLATL